jgi:chromate transporter
LSRGTDPSADAQERELVAELIEHMGVAPAAEPRGRDAAATASVREVFTAFLKLGLTSFGGPIAHLGYFRAEFVERRRWLDEKAFADLVALCQFLPGPASSQVGFALGLSRAGALGALAAWTAFTLPSALLMVAFAFGAAAFDSPIGTSVIHGLKLVAVAVVAQAVLGMARTLTPDRSRAAIAVAALASVLLVGGAIGQLGAIAGGAVLGLILCRNDTVPMPSAIAVRVPRTVGVLCLVVFFSLLVGLPGLRQMGTSQAVALFDAFYRSGALVFGGGHVVLPLLQNEVVPAGWLSNDAFLAGYGAAQAVPGPLFTFAAYLGAAARPEPHGVAGAAIALVAIFLPGLLVLVGALPFWDQLRQRRGAQAALRGANAGVVGLLGAALYQPIWTSAVATPRDFAVAVAGFVALVAWNCPPWLVVGGVVLLAVALHVAGR